MKISRRQFLLPLLSGLLLPALPASAQDNGIDLTPVRRWIARQAKVKTLTADFKQERHLRTVRKPLVSNGKFWFTSAGGGAFRWEAGDPPKLIAVLTPAQEFCIMEPEKKEARFFSREAVEQDGAAQGLGFLKAGFPSSLEDFQKQFQITEVAPDGEFWRVELKPARGGDRVVVRKMVLFILKSSDMLTAMQLHFRDGSWVSNSFTRFRENPAIPAERFQPDLAGYAVKRK